MSARRALLPRLLPGPLHPANKGALDWSAQGFIAHASHSLIVVSDPNSLQIVQVFDGHNAPVVRLAWALDDGYHDVYHPYTLTLASADLTGRIFLWQLHKTKPVARFPSIGRAVAELAWMPGSPDLLAVAYAPGMLAVLDVKQNQRIWSRELSGDVWRFQFDPFSPSSGFLLTTSGTLYTVAGIGNDRAPDAFVRKLHVGAERSSAVMSPTSSTNLPSTPVKKRGSAALATPGELAAASDFVAACYSPSERDVVVLMTRSECLLLDVGVSRIIATMNNEPRAPGFASLLVFRDYPDSFVIVNELGGLTVRTAIEVNGRKTFQVSATADFGRSTKTQFVCLGADGRMHFWRHARDRLTNTGLLEGIFAQVTCQELAASDDVSVPPRAVLGTRTGHLLLLDLRTLAVERCFATHDDPVRGVVWADPDTIVSFAVDELGGKLYKNSVKLTDTRTGRQREIRGGDKSRDNFAISTLSMSKRRHYLAIVFKDGPVEFWDTFTWTMLRMSSSSPSYSNVQAIEWGTVPTATSAPASVPSPARRTRRPRLDTLGSHALIYGEPAAAPMAVPETLALVMGDSTIVCCHVHGAQITEAERVQKSGTASTTAVAWDKRDNLVVIGDAGGSVHFYQFDQSRIRTFSTTYGAVRKIRCAPAGRPQRCFVLLFARGMGLWEGERFECIAYIPFGADSGKEAAASATPGSIGSGSGSGPSSGSGLVGSAPSSGGSWHQLHLLDDAASSPLGALPTPLRSRDRQGSSGAMFGGAVDDVSIVDVEWATSDSLVCWASDGSVRILDTTLRRNSSPLEQYVRRRPVMSLVLQPLRDTFAAKALFALQPWRGNVPIMRLPCGATSVTALAALSDDETENDDHGMNADPMWALLRQCVRHTPEPFYSGLFDMDTNVGERALRTAQLFGDTSEVAFWRAATYYLDQARRDPQLLADLRRGQEGAEKSSSSILQVGSPVLPTAEEDGAPSAPAEEPSLTPSFDGLPPLFDLHLPASVVKSSHVRRLAQRERVSSSHEQLVPTSMLIGEYGTTIRLLLDTPINTPSFKADGLKACLVAALRSPTSLETTVRLVANNLFTNNEPMEAVQLLSLIGRGAEACEYLQSAGMWEEAALLAKSTLPPAERDVALRAWADHLADVDDVDRAIQVLLSMCDFVAALALLNAHGHVEKALLLMEACTEAGLTQSWNESAKMVARDVCIAYAEYVGELGLQVVATAYRKRAADIGTSVRLDSPSTM